MDSLAGPHAQGPAFAGVLSLLLLIAACLGLVHISGYRAGPGVQTQLVLSSRLSAGLTANGYALKNTKRLQLNAQRRVEVQQGSNADMDRESLMPLEAPRSRRDTITNSLAAAIGWTLFTQPSTAASAASVVCTDQAVSHLVGPNGREVFLIGTAHISNISAELVKNVVREVRPETVMLELDAGRIKMAPDGSGPQEGVVGSRASLSLAERARRDLFTGSKPFGVRLQKLQADLIGGLLAAFYSALNQMGFDSGQEFIVALQEAKALNANIVLGDQPIDITLQRLQQALAVSDLSKMFSPPDSMNEVEIEVAQALNSGSKAELAGAVELLKQRSQVRELVAVMKQQLPEVYQALLAERDSYMANSLRNSPGQRIVGVVGIAHMDGIEKKLGYERINC
jgi:hypothetical protein